jgi:hypothetical protein
MSNEEIVKENIPEEKPLENLEDLIRNGIDSKTPVTLTINGTDYGGYISPVSTKRWTQLNNMTKGKNNDKNFNALIVQEGLSTKTGEKIPLDLIEKFPAGYVADIAKQITDISGVVEDKEMQEKIIKEIAGF